MSSRNNYFFKVDEPLMAPPPYGTMTACGFFEGVEKLVRSHGGNFEQVIERHGMEAAAAHDPDYAIRCTSAAAILDDCSQTFDDRLFGLRLGTVLQADVYGALTTYARAAPDMRQSIKVLLEYMPVVYCPEADVDFVTTNGTAEFRWRPCSDFDDNEQANYFGQSQVVRFLQTLIGPGFRPSAVHVVSMPWRKDIEAMERFFGGTVHGNAAANIISFPTGLLDGRNSAANPVLFSLLGRYFAQVRKFSRDNIIDLVRAYVRANLATGDCKIERCAAKLRASTRSIQRRLIEHGLHFSEIVEQERIEAAKRALIETDDSLSEIALNLGYSDQGSFGRAFKRWTNRTPQNFRNSDEPPRALH